MASPLKGKWVLITGASSGFGAAAARAFGTEGARLLLGARRLERVEKIAEEARQAGAAEAHSHFLDVTQTSSVDAFLGWARERIASSQSQIAKEAGASARSRTEKSSLRERQSSGQSKEPALDVLINNAGGAHGLEPVAQGREEDWETMLQTNVLGLLRVTRAALPLMLRNPGSSIINIGSVAGHTAYEGGAAYCAAKAGELQITRALRLELNGTGIRVSTVDPGLAETEFSIVRFKGDATRAKKVYEGTQPLKAEDIAEILVWVASRPPHVDIDELIVKPVDQAEVYKLYRRRT